MNALKSQRRLAASAAAVAALALTLVGGLPAHADEPAALDRISSGESTSTSYTDPGCVDALPTGADSSVCDITTTLSLGEPSAVTVADVLADDGLSASAKSEILATADARGVLAVSSNHWSQFVTGAVYTNTQNGTFYYNGSRAWVTGTYLGYTGSHACFTNYVVPPWGISNIAKSDSGGTSFRNLYCGWNVDQAGLFTTSWSMTATVYSDGTISGGGATVG